MSDSFGLLTLPASADDLPAGDPLISVLLSFVAAVVNADGRAVWSKICPAVPDPIAFTFPHDPDPTTFSTKRTPALYAWRGDGKLFGHFSQEFESDSTPIQMLWVPPLATQDHARIRHAFPNAIRKTLLRALRQGRHPAWIVPDDTYFSPTVYGSVLLRQARCAQLRLGDFKHYDLVIDNFDSKAKTSYDAILFSIEPLELAIPDANRFGVPLANVHGTMQLGPDADDLLVVQSFQFDLALDSIAPSSGTAAGGTTVTLTGKQFVDGMDVRFGAALATDVTLIDESTCTVVTPAHAASVVDVTVSTPADAATLAAAFTFT